MITEDYVSYDTAKLLREKGFDVPCKVWYSEYTSQFGGEKYTTIEFDNHNRFNENYKFICFCPTLQMAMKWLRENKGIAIVPFVSSVLDNEKFIWDIKIIVAKTYETYMQGWVYESYENACEKAIRHCLGNLI